jgi:hypothetical protein
MDKLALEQARVVREGVGQFGAPQLGERTDTLQRP